MSRTVARRIVAPVAAFAVGLAMLVTLPATAAAQNGKPTVAVTAIDFGAGSIEITNNGDAEVDPNGLILCNFPTYVPIEGASPIAPGESITVDAAGLGVPLDAASGELGLYASNDFESAEAIVSYVEWGESGHQRGPVAEAAGLWHEGAAEPVDGVLTATTDNPTSPDDWGAAAQEPEGGDDTGAGQDDGAAGELAQTGAETAQLVVIAAALVLAGAGLATFGRRRARLES